MKYKPVVFDDTVNVPHRSFLKEFVILLIAMIIIIMVVFKTIEYTAVAVVSNLSTEDERWLWDKLTGDLQWWTLSSDNQLEIKYKAKLDYVRARIDQLPDQLINSAYTYHVVVVNDDQPNAIALPGGNILLTTALLDNVITNKGLMFVVAHELGHFNNKDHMRMLARSLSTLVVSLFVFGQESDLSNAVGSISTGVALSYGRQQELEADRVALRIYHHIYGSYEGATEFFEYIQKQHEDFPMLEWFSTHPLTEDRIKEVERMSNRL